MSILKLRYLVVIPLLALGFSLIGVASAQNSQTVNDSFENNINKYANHGNNAQFVHTNKASEARTGNRALKITSTNSDNKPNSIKELTRWFTKINAIPVKEGEKYRISVYMKSENLKDNAKLAVSFFESTSGQSWIKTESARKTLTGTTGWTETVIDISVPRDATYMRPEFRLFDRGTLWVDDFKVALITNESSNNQTNENNNQNDNQTNENNNQTTPRNNDPAETVTRDQPPEDVAVNQPSKSLESSDYKINFAQSAVLSAKKVPANLVMRISFPVNCTFSHQENDDPIVFPNQPGASHSHDFFGDTKVNADSTVQEILDNGGNTCNVPDDRSAYWVPSVYQDGREQRASRTKFYYKAGFLDPSTLQEMPTGLRVIAGNANTKTNQSPQVGFWYAAPDLVSPENVPNLANSTRGKNTMVTAKPNEGISLRINFPQCWDGENLYLPNSVHMAYPKKRSGATFAECPATHPVPVPMLLLIIDYPTARGGNGFSLSSGSWNTFHADFVNAWQPQAFNGLVDSCLKSESRCRVVQPRSCGERGLSESKCAEVRR